ncbi:MAG: methionyl-tRNA formyltransferase [Rubrobacteraceae bacterium]|nr:methionyl-tRNA formyltransferase [Rubrobacteraceae bacterium]
MKVAFAGTPDFAATILRALISSPHDVGLVISQPDPRKGRGRKTTPTPVAELARSHDLLLTQPARISEISDELAAYDALIVAAYGQILRPDSLYATRRGAWNVHASLLPKYRGAAPVERAIMNGETETGVTIMRMDEGLDTGPMALQRSVNIPPDVNAGELAGLLAGAGAKAIVESLSLLENDSLTLVEQDSLFATYASKVLDEDRILRWEWGVRQVHDVIRALAPGIGARTSHPEVEGPIKIWRSRILESESVSLEAGRIEAGNGRMVVYCGSGSLEVLDLQRPGGRRLPARDFLRGTPLEGAFV